MHPLQTQAVSYVVQRYESMMGLFYLLTLYSFIRSATSSRHSRPWAITSAVACLLAMGCKEVAVTAPIIVLLYDRAFLAGSVAAAWRRRWALYLALAAAWLVYLPLYRLASGSGSQAWAGFGIEATPYQYALTQTGVILHYLRLCYWPVGQCLDYGWPIAKSFAEVALPFSAIGSLLGLTLWLSWRHPAWGFPGVWFFLILAPTSSVMPIVDPAYEHRMYLPLAAVACVTVLGGYEMIRRHPGWHLGLRPTALYSLSIVTIAFVLGGLSFARNRVYASKVSLWEDTVRQCPNNPRAQANLGISLWAKNDLVAAREHLEAALRLDPARGLLHFHYGCLLSKMGESQEGIVHLQQAIRTEPRNAHAHFALANLLADRGDIGAALGHWNTAVRLEPQYVPARVNLARLWPASMTRVRPKSRFKKRCNWNLRMPPLGR